MLGICPLVASAMPTDIARERAIDYELAAVEGSSNMPSYESASVPEQQASVTNVDRPIQNANGYGYASVQPQKTMLERRHNNEIAFQMASYLYETEDKWPFYYPYTVADKVKKNGSLFGFYGAKTWSLSEPLKTWSDIWKTSPFPNFVKVEAEGSLGRTDYSSFATGKRQGFDACELDARLLFGYDYIWSTATLFTPYVGFGYRRFSDETGGWEDFVVNNYVGFKTETNFFYVPVGFETLTQLNDQWDLTFKMEGDLVVGGSVNYFLNEIPGPFTGTDTETGLPVTVNLQKSTSDLKAGWGFRTSMKIIRKYNAFDIYAEPFFKFWSLKQSDAMQEHAASATKDYVSAYPDGSPYKPLWTPQNFTSTLGLRMGVQF